MSFPEELVIDRKWAESLHRYCIGALRGKEFRTYPGNMLRYAYNVRDCMNHSGFYEFARDITREIGVFCDVNREELARARLNKKVKR